MRARLGRPAADQAADLGAELHQAAEGGGFESEHLVGPLRERLHQREGVAYALLRLRVEPLEAGIVDAALQDIDSGVEFARLALPHDGAQQLPRILGGLEVIAPVAYVVQDMDSGVEFARLALPHDGAQQLPRILGGLEVIAPVAYVVQDIDSGVEFARLALPHD